MLFVLIGLLDIEAAAAPAPEVAAASAEGDSDAASWIGGNIELGGFATKDDQGSMLGSNISQVEVDARFEKGIFYGRLDLDYHFDLENLGDVPLKPYAPEWAMLQIGEPIFRVRLGVTNPMIGLEDWDDHLNYMPTLSLMYDAMPGRILGGEVAGATFGDTEVFVFAGRDLEWEALASGVGLWRSGDDWSTWSGIQVMPDIDYYALWIALELYPDEDFSIAFDGGGGLAYDSVVAGGQIVCNLWPEEQVTPVARVEYGHDPDGVVLAGDFSGGLGVRYTPWEYVKLALEAKVSHSDAGTTPGGFLTVNLFRPEPEAYTARLEEDDEESGGAPAGEAPPATGEGGGTPAPAPKE